MNVATIECALSLELTVSVSAILDLVHPEVAAVEILNNNKKNAPIPLLNL